MCLSDSCCSVNNYSIFSYSLYEITTESENYEYGKVLNVWRKNAQVLTPIMMPKISRYIKKVDIFFDDTIRYDISISKTTYRYFDIQSHHYPAYILFDWCRLKYMGPFPAFPFPPMAPYGHGCCNNGAVQLAAAIRRTV